MKKLFIAGFMLFCYGYSFGQSQPVTPVTMPATRPPADPHVMTHFMTEIMDPEIKMVQSGAKDSDAPSDAIVLFNGGDISNEWVDSKGAPSKWIVKDGLLICVPKSGIIKTKRKFNDFQLHIEWRTPDPGVGEGQSRGNSGVFLQELYELQILDSYNNRTYRNGQAGALYKQYAPLVNVSKKPGEWQTYDVIFTAPRFASDGTSFFTPPRVTVIHNGVLIQNNVSLRGPTLNAGMPEYSVKKYESGSLMLQDHGNPVAYRNIWVREL